MSINPTSHKFPQKGLHFFLAAIIIFAVIVLAIYILPKARVKGAKLFAIRLSENIPPPLDAVAINNWSGGNYESWDCYSGYAYLLYGSNLELTEVTEYYSNYFTQQGSTVIPLKGFDMTFADGKTVDVNETTLHVTGRGKIDNYNIEVIPCTQYSACNGFLTDSIFPSSPEDKQIL